MDNLVIKMLGRGGVAVRELVCSGSQCRPNECIFGSGKLRGVGILGKGVNEPGEENGEVSLRATWERGGRILSQQGGFQVSAEG